MPEDPYEAARVRLWADRLNREVVRREEDERREHFRSLLKGRCGIFPRSWRRRRDRCCCRTRSCPAPTCP